MNIQKKKRINTAPGGFVLPMLVKVKEREKFIVETLRVI